MTDFEEKWRQTADECRQLREQVDRLKGNRKENPTLRDQFAMVALHGMVTRVSWPGDEKNDAAKAAYTYADAMMKHREQQ